MVIDYFTKKVIEGQQLEELIKAEGLDCETEMYIQAIGDTMRTLADAKFIIQDLVMVIPGPKKTTAILSVNPLATDKENRETLYKATNRLTEVINEKIEDPVPPTAS